MNEKTLFHEPAHCGCLILGNGDPTDKLRIELCPMHQAAQPMLAALVRLREAFYVTGKRKALIAAFDGTKELVAQAKAIDHQQYLPGGIG